MDVGARQECRGLCWARECPARRQIFSTSAWRTRVPEELYSTTFVEQETISYLENHANEGSGNPFLFSARSRIRIIPLRHPGAIGACMIRWTARHPPQSTAHPMTRHRSEKCCGMNFAKTIGAQGGSLRRDGARSTGECCLDLRHDFFCDDSIGRILGTLDDLGLATRR